MQFCARRIPEASLDSIRDKSFSPRRNPEMAAVILANATVRSGWFLKLSHYSVALFFTFLKAPINSRVSHYFMLFKVIIAACSIGVVAMTLLVVRTKALQQLLGNWNTLRMVVF